MQTLGPYRLLEELGRGGMGAVFRAQDARTGEVVVLKVLLDAAPNPIQLLRFRREAEALDGLEHPHLVRCVGYSFAPPRPYAVFEFVEGETLEARVAREGPLPWDEAVAVVAQVAAGVEAAHARRVLHRDIKPANVLLGPSGPKLLDFGLVKELDRESLTESGATLGTPGYLAPEQVSADRERWGPATDVYGLGATLHFALTGGPPFQGPTTIATLEQILREAPPSARALVPAVPAWVDLLCRRCLAKLGDERPPSAHALRTALLSGAEGSQAGRRGGRALAIGAVLALLAVAVLAVARRGQSGAGKDPAPPPRAASPSAESALDPESARRALDAASARLLAGGEAALGDYLLALDGLDGVEARRAALFQTEEGLRRREQFELGRQLLERSGDLAATAEGEARKAVLAFATLDLAAALSHLDQARRHDSTEPLIYQAAAMVWTRRLSELTEARREGGRTTAAQRLEAEDSLRECMPWLDAAVREEPDALGPVLVRASALLALRRYADALAEAERGLRAYPQDSTLRGIARKARGTLERRAQLSPCEVAFARGLELLAAGRPDEASRQVELARQELPPDPALLLRFAERLIEAHQPEAARAFLTRHDPALTQASAAGKLEWARTALHLEGLGESLRWVDLALAQEPSLERARDWRLSLMIVLSRRSRANLAKDPDDTPAQRNLEEARSALEGYLSQLDETLAEVPGDSVHRQARVQVLIELGRREEALADCERGIELDPAYPPLRRLRQGLTAAAE